ncbi:hypothetical protein HDU93_002719 [Gonapodya sp. JEL0774]|nr:hypothetical protein HDU93_002719 [Gonapodya sp. JEL0774]
MPAFAQGPSTWAEPRCTNAGGEFVAQASCALCLFLSKIAKCVVLHGPRQYPSSKPLVLGGRVFTGTPNPPIADPDDIKLPTPPSADPTKIPRSGWGIYDKVDVRQRRAMYSHDLLVQVSRAVHSKWTTLAYRSKERRRLGTLMKDLDSTALSLQGHMDKFFSSDMYRLTPEPVYTMLEEINRTRQATNAVTVRNSKRRVERDESTVALEEARKRYRKADEEKENKRELAGGE